MKNRGRFSLNFALSKIGMLPILLIFWSVILYMGDFHFFLKKREFKMLIKKWKYNLKLVAYIIRSLYP